MSDDFFDDIDDYSDSLSDDGYSIDDYIYEKRLGHGMSGEVVLMKQDGVSYAAKVVLIRKKKNPFMHSVSHDAKAEAVILLSLSHPNVVKVHKFIDDVDNSRLFIIMELLSGGSIESCDTNEKKKKAFGQVLSGLHYCHMNKLVHRDIKIENVMLDEHGNAKICDFGLSKFVDGDTGKTKLEWAGTAAYMAPEMFGPGPEYDPFKADVWALGTLLYKLMFHTLPCGPRQMTGEAESWEAEYPDDADPLLVDLLKRMLDPDPAQRSDLAGLRQHKWLSQAAAFLDFLRISHNVLLEITPEKLSASIARTSRGKIAHRRAPVRPKPHKDS